MFMKRISIIIIAFAATFAGCGEQANEQVYDRENNPHGFPNQAVVLLEQVESGKLATFDLIAQSFNDLYTNHPELLDNTHWREVITRLGGEFETRADEFAARGIDYYAQAGGYYTLAAFARPDDKALLEKSRLFEGWTDALRSLTSNPLRRDTSQTLTGITQVTRELMLGDSRQQEFARQYVIDNYLQPLVRDSGVAHLPTADQAFLSWLGMARLTRYEPLVVFSQPPVQLITARTSLDRPNLRLELYLMATDSLESDWQLALLGVNPDADTIFVAPQPPTSEWRPDAVQVVTQQVNYVHPDNGVALGLFLGKDGTYRWSSAEGKSGPIHIIDAPPTP